MMVRRYSKPTLLRAALIFGLFAFTAFSFAADPAALTWTQLQPANAFPARASFATAYDPISQKVVVFGGYDVNGTVYNDTWTFDGSTWQTVTTATKPPGRFGATMAYDSAT